MRTALKPCVLPVHNRFHRLLDALLQRGDPTVAFFVIGFRVEQRPEALREMAADGFEIGSHTYDHDKYRFASSERAIGYTLFVLRMPLGC